jgi:hypothetical protein
VHAIGDKANELLLDISRAIGATACATGAS